MPTLYGPTDGFGGPIVPSGGGTIRLPLDLTLVDAGATYTGVFRPGTISGLIPSNYTGLAGIAKTGAVYIVLNTTFSSGAPTTASFATAGSAPAATSPTMGTPPSSLSILTHIVIDGTVFRVIGTGSLFAQSEIVFYTDKTGPVGVGEKPTDTWYTYNVVNS